MKKSVLFCAMIAIGGVVSGAQRAIWAPAANAWCWEKLKKVRRACSCGTSAKYNHQPKLSVPTLDRITSGVPLTTLPVAEDDLKRRFDKARQQPDAGDIIAATSFPTFKVNKPPIELAQDMFEVSPALVGLSSTVSQKMNSDERQRIIRQLSADPRRRDTLLASAAKMNAMHVGAQQYLAEKKKREEEAKLAEERREESRLSRIGSPTVYCIPSTTRTTLSSPSAVRGTRAISSSDTQPQPQLSLPGSPMSPTEIPERPDSSSSASSGGGDETALGGGNPVLVEVSKKAMRASKGSHWQFGGSTPVRAADDSPPSHDNTDVHFMA